jgi:hypothetical protein
MWREETICGVILLLALSATAAAQAQTLETQKGSLVVSIFSRRGDYIVVAAESRQLDNEHKQVDDDACKIVALGTETLFFETGTAVIGPLRGPVWNSVAKARAVYRHSTDRSAKKLSVAWANEALAWFYQQPESATQTITDEHGGLMTGGFIEFTKDGNLDFHSQTVSYISTNHSISRAEDSPPPKAGQVVIAGTGKPLASEFLKGDTIRAAQAYGPIGVVRLFGVNAESDVRDAINTIRFVEEYSTGVDKIALGGPIDIAVLRNNRTIEWVSRKANCYKQDVAPPKDTKSKSPTLPAKPTATPP